MILPDLPLAKSLTAVVIDEIERSRTISSAGLEEAILSKLLYVNVMQEMARPAVADDKTAELAVALVVALSRTVVISSTPPEVQKAFNALNDHLVDAGKL